ncbi:MAG: ketopantoate reductase family protein [Eubacteriales bacterium]
MIINKIGLIGLGVIGSPIAHKLWLKYKDDFCVLASGEIKEYLTSSDIFINDEIFAPKIISDKHELGCELDLVIVCVKNYHLESVVDDINNVVGVNTIILPLQNGVYAYDFFKEKFHNNIVLHGYMQGPNTEVNGLNINYKNSGEIHLGSNVNPGMAIDVYNVLHVSKFPVKYENDILHMVWKKWMLNVAGNSVTALTGADYSMFKESKELVSICRQAMEEFLLVADASGVDLSEDDIEDIVLYYTTYSGNKKTSMLEDIVNRRRTENEYLAGYAVDIAYKYNIKIPIIESLYKLITIKEVVS